MSVPAIDIGPYLQGGVEDRRKVAEAIAAACEESGFFCITGHGVPAELIARTRQAAADFFALPVSEKRLILRPESRVGRGYYPFADRSLAYTLGVETPPDLQEAFAMGPPEVPGRSLLQGRDGGLFLRRQPLPRAAGRVPRDGGRIFPHPARPRRPADGGDGGWRWGSTSASSPTRSTGRPA